MSRGGKWKKRSTKPDDKQEVKEVADLMEALMINSTACH